jgi:outer membrane lipoprotein SlyB
MIRQVLVIGLASALSGCASYTVRTTDHTPLRPATVAQEQQAVYLDVGVVAMDPGLDVSAKNEEVIFPEIRIAESNFHAQKLAATIQRSGHWGAVRVVPNMDVLTEVQVDSKILKSDGESLELQVKVTDAAGKQWFDRKFVEVTSKLAYERQQLRRADPFDGMYNQIANAMADYLLKQDADNLNNVRTITELRFAGEFSPEVFSDYLSRNRSGRYSFSRLPAENDPAVEKIRFIRERDYLFVDTLQEYYDIFSRDMEVPYNEWRKASYTEVQELRDLKRRSNMEMLVGAAAIVGGIASAATSGTAGGYLGGASLASAGGYLIRRAVETRDQMSTSIDVLQELGSSLQSEVEQRVIELDDRTVRLTGSVNEQYLRWKEVLREIYRDEYGEVEAPMDAS